MTLQIKSDVTIKYSPFNFKSLTVHSEVAFR